MAQQTIRLGTMEFENPLIINAGGTLKDWDELPALLETSLQIILFGAMLEPLRPGNQGGIAQTLLVQSVAGLKVSYNRMGLPEKYGLEWSKQNLVGKNQLVADCGKVLAINIAGFSEGELTRLAQVCHSAGIRIIFVDISCANTDQEPICFSPEATRDALLAVKEAAPNAVIGVKLPYIPLPSLLKELVEVCKEVSVDVLELINAMGQYHPADEHGTLRLGGPASGGGYLAKDAAQGMVTRVKSLLGDESPIQIMATGGTGCGPDANAGLDILDYERRGATLFGVHTAARSTEFPYDVQPQVFDDIRADYLALRELESRST